MEFCGSFRFCWLMTLHLLCCFNKKFCSLLVPYWKIFIFGGNSGDLNDGGNPQGQYLNDTVVLETGTNTWTRPSVLGTIPTERGETQIVYDPKGYGTNN